MRDVCPFPEVKITCHSEIYESFTDKIKSQRTAHDAKLKVTPEYNYLYSTDVRVAYLKN